MTEIGYFSLLITNQKFGTGLHHFQFHAKQADLRFLLTAHESALWITTVQGEWTVKFDEGQEKGKAAREIRPYSSTAIVPIVLLILICKNHWKKSLMTLNLQSPPPMPHFPLHWHLSARCMLCSYAKLALRPPGTAMGWSMRIWKSRPSVSLFVHW